MERPFDKIAEFTMARPVIKPKPGSFYLADKPAGAFLANILGFVAPFEFQKSVSLSWRIYIYNKWKREDLNFFSSS